jgi:HK97 family phage major capsid protein
MKGKMSPGQRVRLAALGIDPSEVGRISNRSNGGRNDILPKDVPIPANGDELAEFFGDSTRYSAILKDNQTLQTFIKAYADQQQGPDTDLGKTVAAETQKALINFLKEHGDDTPRDTVRRLNLDPQDAPAGMRTSHRQAAAYNPEAPGAVLDKEFKSGSDYFRHAWHLQQNAEMLGKMERIKNAYSSVVPSDGGFLVPESLRSGLLEIALESSIVRPRATVVPMETATVDFPAIDSSTNVGSVYGGMVAYWTEESAALIESQAKFMRIRLDAKTLTGLAVVPNQLLADSMASFAALLETAWPRTLAWYEDLAYMAGTGVGEPLGFMGAGNSAAVEQAKETGQSAATIVLENIIKMYSRMLPGSLARGIWVVSPETLPELFTLALSVGTGGGPVMLTNVAGPAPMTIFGRPIVVSEKAGRLGTRSDISFVDLSYYLIGDRQTMSTDSSTHWKFGNNQTAFRIIQRVDGRPWVQTPITPQNGGPTLSPFVELATRA